MKLLEIKGSDKNFGAVVEMLVKHFNYSIRDINSYDELTSEEKNIIDRSLFDEVTTSDKLGSHRYNEDDLYVPITWPDIQYFMDLDGFNSNSYLINDNKGINDFGSSAYMVSKKWINSLNK